MSEESGATETIKEFLVDLGFKVDSDGLKKFEGGVGSATKSVAALGLGAVAAGTAIEAMVLKASHQMEDLYYASQRSGASATNLQSFGYAASQVGIDAGRASAMIESMASAMRLNPGTENVMRNIGVQTRDASGHLRDAKDIFTEVIGSLKKMGEPGTMGFAMASRYAEMFGIDPTSLMMLEKNFDQLKKFQDDHNARLKDAGLDPDKAAADFHEFSQEWRKLGDEFDVVFTKIAHDFLGPVEDSVKWLEKSLEYFAKLDKATENWAENFIGVKMTLGEITTIVTTLLGITTAAGVAKGALGWLGGARGAAAETGAATTAVVEAATAAGTKAGVGAAIGALARFAGPLGAAYAILNPTTANEGEDANLAAFKALGLGLDGKLSKDKHELDEKAINYFMSQGHSAEHAVGLVANLKRESGMNQEAVGDNGDAYGLGQWHKDRQDLFRKQFGKDIKQSTFDEQLKFVEWELHNNEKKAGDNLSKTTTAADAAGLLTREYSRPKAKDSEARKGGEIATNLMKDYQFQKPQTEIPSRSDLPSFLTDRKDAADAKAGKENLSPIGPSPSQVQQMGIKVDAKTNINILAGPDAQSTAQKVAGEQDRANANLVRNLGGAIQ